MGTSLYVLSGVELLPHFQRRHGAEVAVSFNSYPEGPAPLDVCNSEREKLPISTAKPFTMPQR